MLALRTVNVNAAAAPARIPDFSVDVDNRAIEPAGAAVLQQYLGFAERQAARRIDRNAVQDVCSRVGKIAERAVWRKADRVGNGDAGEQQRDLTAIQRIDYPRSPLCLAAHGADPERAG